MVATAERVNQPRMVDVAGTEGRAARASGARVPLTAALVVEEAMGVTVAVQGISASLLHRRITIRLTLERAVVSETAALVVLLDPAVPAAWEVEVATEVTVATQGILPSLFHRGVTTCLTSEGSAARVTVVAEESPV